MYMIKPKLAVFVHHPECSVQSAHGIIRALSDQYNVYCISTANLRDRHLNRYDILAFPGGIGDSDSWYKILQPFQDVIQNQVYHGRRYLGICMGAYWAGKYYFDLLQGYDAVQYIKRPNSDIRRSFGTVLEVNWNHVTEHMYFYDGCALVTTGGRGRVIARYTNGDAAALIQGRVGVIGPHPESDIYWYTKSYMLPYWHDYHHHNLLKQFTKQLLAR